MTKTTKNLDLTPHYTRGPHLICNGKTHHWDDLVQIAEWCDSKGGRASHAAQIN